MFVWVGVGDEARRSRVLRDITKSTRPCLAEHGTVSLRSFVPRRRQDAAEQGSAVIMGTCSVTTRPGVYTLISHKGHSSLGLSSTSSVKGERKGWLLYGIHGFTSVGHLTISYQT